MSGKIVRKSFAYSNRYFAVTHLTENSREETGDPRKKWS